MALRHALPINRFPDFRSEAEPTVAPPTMRAAHVVEFRPSTNLDELVAGMTKHTRVKVSAPAGAGKSTELPRRLAKAMNMPIVLAVPSEFLAIDHFNYLNGKYPGEFRSALEEGDELAEKGVTVTTYAWLTGKFLQLKGRALPLGRFVLMADEVHESDAYSDFIRRLGSNLPGVTCFVEMSATHEPTGAQRLELKGKLSTEFYPKQLPSTWDPDEHGKPWSISSLDCNMLILLDDNRIAEGLQAKYVRAGFSAYRLHSRMPRKRFEDIMAETRDPRKGIVVLIADYASRIGLSFDVSRIVDSAFVRETVVRDGKVSHVSRVLFEPEMYQSMARGARTAGSKCVYYIPAGVEFDSAMSVLEEVEMEASCLLFRLYGYLPPVTHTSKMSFGKIPRDIAAALNSVQPLALISDFELVDAVVEKRKSVTDVVDVLESYGMVEESGETEISDLFAGYVGGNEKVVPTAVAGDFLEQLQELSSSSQTLEPGFYYYCGEALATGALGGQQVQDLAAMIHKKPLVVTGMGAAERKEAVFLLLQEYNKCTLMQAAMSRISAHSDALTNMVKTYPEQVKVWSKWITAMGREQASLASSYLAAVSMVRSPTMNVRRVEPDSALEESRARELVAPLLAAVEAASVEVDRGKFFASIGEHAGVMPSLEFPAVKAITGRVVAEEDDLGSRCSWKQVYVGKTIMHDMVFQPKNPVQWDTQQYVAAVTAMLQKQGVVPESIRRLVIEAPRVDSDVVMQAVRDGTVSKQKMTRFVVKSASRR